VCHVDMERRLNLSRNHTTTHLVNKILREILNDPNLIQKASLIHEDYFIFEYSSINIDTSNTIFDELEKRVSYLQIRDENQFSLNFRSMKSFISIFQYRLVHIITIRFVLIRISIVYRMNHIPPMFVVLISVHPILVNYVVEHMSYRRIKSKIFLLFVLIPKVKVVNVFIV
jgi:hypothetical protein